MHEAWPWDELVARREQFRTTTCVAQYEGYVADHLHKARAFAQAADASGQVDEGALAAPAGQPTAPPKALPGQPVAPPVDANLVERQANLKKFSKAAYNAFHKLFECSR